MSMVFIGSFCGSGWSTAGSFTPKVGAILAAYVNGGDYVTTIYGGWTSSTIMMLVLGAVEALVQVP